MQGDYDYRRPAHPGGQPAEEARFRLVDVDDGEPLRVDQADEADEGGRVAGRRDVTAELRNAHGPYPGPVGALPEWSAAAGRYPDVVAARVHAQRGHERVAARTVLEPGDHVQDLDSAPRRIDRQPAGLQHR